MDILKFCFSFFFLLHSSTIGEDTDSEAQCQTALTDWLLRYGEKTYYDRLSRALHHIGRTDIATEVGKNINQDKALSLKRYVEDYHKYVNSLNFVSDTKQQKRGHQRVRKTKVSDLTWRDLDLIVEQVRVPPYQKGPLDVALPVLYGLLLGFGGTLLIGTALLLIIVHISHGRPQNCHSRATSSSSSKVM
ncbi:transmembrane and death domain protein 1-like isoform X2 [Oreochromis aureus]|uniref:transmembrane and death domain protein 1-like isoform X2 n=1 Tax=Oreochromis aureus TaxID=47969 RepID=UPI001953B75A|nr:transmembrane and death domain protein 1-like isoform X2 [Oreochromis aureus]